MATGIIKPSNISGFNELLPEEKLVEDRFLNRIKSIYELHGFTPIETAAVEMLETLEVEGEITREIFLVSRKVHDAGESSEAKLALHYDLTVPFARYTAQNFDKLSFPFRRYQIQKSWRGERAQEGRAREFYQCDIDIIARDNLPLSCDAEILTVVDKVLSTLEIGKHLIRVNNRKILHGFYSSFGLNEATRVQVIGAVDKLAKIGESGVTKELAKLGVSSEIAQKILDFCKRKASPADLSAKMSDLKVDSQLYAEGLAELSKVLELVPEKNRGSILIDFSLARGLDYYTGLILETYLVDHMNIGSVCGGGRYDDLASRFTKFKLPGVGVSVGLTRIMSAVVSKKLANFDKRVPTKVLVSVYSEEQRKRCNEVAEQLRSLNVSTEVYFSDAKLGKQIEYADKKGIQYILFINAETGAMEVKDINTKQQSPLNNLEEWASKI